MLDSAKLFWSSHQLQLNKFFFDCENRPVGSFFELVRPLQGRGKVKNDCEAIVGMFTSDCTRKRAKVGESGGIHPQENFEILHLRRSILVYFQ